MMMMKMMTTTEEIYHRFSHFTVRDVSVREDNFNQERKIDFKMYTILSPEGQIQGQVKIEQNNYTLVNNTTLMGTATH